MQSIKTKRRGKESGRKIDTLAHHTMDKRYLVDVYMTPDYVFRLEVQPDETDKRLVRKPGIVLEGKNLDELVQQMSSTLNALGVATWEKRIAIWIENDGGWRGEHRAGVELAFMQCERGTSKGGEKFTRDSSGYVSKGWPSENRHLKKTDGSRDLPYTEELWTALCEARNRLEAIGEKLSDLVYMSKEPELIAVLTSNNMLPSPS